MLKKVTFAALVALGTLSLTGLPSSQVVAEGIHGGADYRSGTAHRSTDRHFEGRRVEDRRGDREARHARTRHQDKKRRFLKRVRRGEISCYRKASRSRLLRSIHWDGYNFSRRHGRKLGYRTVKRMVRKGKTYKMRCIRRF